MTLEKFVTLFRGRGDCYGSNEGGCVREPLTQQVFANHLEGTLAIGVYPSVPAPTPFCVWGCSDIDVEDLASARLLQRTMGMAGIVSWVERSRSKGYHVWVFASEPVSSLVMRRALLVVHQVANYPAREVNPKQTDVSATKVGNYVRLPYFGGYYGTPTKQVVLDDNNIPMSLNDFVDKATQFSTKLELLENIANMYVEPPKTTITDMSHWDDVTDENVETALALTSQLARIIWRDGPLEGQDRSRALTRLAHVCSRSGVTPSMTNLIVVSADKRWGKYHLRGESGVQEIQKIIARAYCE